MRADTPVRDGSVERSGSREGTPSSKADASSSSRSEVPVDWRKVHALGLPSGSIRALLAILVFATVWCSVLMRPTREIPDYLGDLLFIIMGHYFAARRRAAAEPEPGPPPLFLPRGSVRLLL